ncbi:MAG: D-glycerate dehydrogenase [Gammaproteobacteria bacterium]|nr:D-glycerate dehydrogenase [Gammaproteobacteria bacterium]
MSKPRVLVTRRWPESVEKAMAINFEVTLNDDDHAMSADELAKALQEYDAVCPCVTDSMPQSLFGASFIKTRIIGNYGVGFDHIAIDAAKSKGIVVTNTPDVLTDATADLAMTLMLMLARRAGEGERQLRAGQWHGWYPTHLMGTQVTGKSLGIVGMGRIGKAMAEKAHFGFGMKILYHNRKPIPESEERRLNAEYCTELTWLMSRSDFVSLHCPSSPRTKGMVNEKTLACMRPDAFLINTSRGDVVVEKALIKFLQKGLIAGAGLDVYDNEPELPEALLALDNLVLLPHLGSATKETRTAMGMRVLGNLNAFFNGEEPPDKL